MLKRIWEKLLDLLFPRKCAACADAADKDSPLCKRCADRYAAEARSRCPVCGGAPAECVCKSDIECVFLTFYRGYDSIDSGVTTSCIYHLKHHSNQCLADFFARELAFRLLRKIKLEGLDVNDHVLTYIPRSTKNLQKYGFDHGRLLCERVSYYTGIPMETLFTRHGGEEQKKMSSAERTKNARSTIGAVEDMDVLGKRVILVDDVTTTGATVARAAELLLSRGAADIVSAVIAKTAWR